MSIDKHTICLFEILKNLTYINKTYNKHVYFSGGFALDFHVGKFTRSHKDIEFYVHYNDLDFWINWFIKNGYYCNKRSLGTSYAFVVKPEEKAKVKYLDVHAYMIDRDGYIIIFDTKTGEKIKQNYKYKTEINLVNFNELSNIPVLSVKILKYYKEKRLEIGKDLYANHDLSKLNNLL